MRIIRRVIDHDCVRIDSFSVSDRETLVGLRHAVWQPGESNPLPQCGTHAGTGDAANGLALFDHGHSVFRNHRALVEDIRHQAVLDATILEILEERLAKEVGLVVLDGEADSGFIGIAERVRVGSGDQVPLLQTQDALRFHTERPDVLRLALFKQVIPQLKMLVVQTKV